MFKGIDLSSDTASLPTPDMKKAMLEAELGDEMRGEDPTTRLLEEKIAALLGFNAALFFPTATMANEVAICALTQPGEELLAAENSHLFFAEAGGPAIHANVMCRPIRTNTGIFSGDDIKKTYRAIKGIHLPISKLVSVENTANLAGGIAWTAAQLNDVVSTAKALDLKLHMDGARFFNANIKTRLTPQEIVKGFDTVTVCLTKGLGCPVGALLVFDKSQFPTIRRLKQVMGGAMRQSGILAAAGLYALEHHIERLAEDHHNATIFAQELSEVSPYIHVMNNPPETNIVLFEWRSDKISTEQFLKRCIEKGVRFSQVGTHILRAVTYLNVWTEEIHQAVKIVRSICQEI
jgi:threonine aldolase